MTAPRTGERSREVRERVLDAATELIPKLGWGSVSTRLLAERAGIAPGLVHYHFDSVQAVLVEASVRAVAGMTEGFVEQLRAQSAESGIRTLLDLLGVYPGDDPASLLISEAYLASTRDPELREQLAALVAAFRARLTAWLADDGVANADAVAVVIAALLDGLLLHQALGAAPGERLAPVVLRLLERKDS